MTRNTKQLNPVIARWWVSEVGYKWIHDDEAFWLRSTDTGLSRAVSPAGELEDLSRVDPLEDELFQRQEFLIIDSDPAIRPHQDCLCVMYEPMEVIGLHRTFAAINLQPLGVASSPNFGADQHFGQRSISGEDRKRLRALVERQLLDFANRYGFLGDRTEIFRAVRKTGESGTSLERWRLTFLDEHEYIGESYANWMTCQFELSTLVRLWDLYRDPSPAGLEELNNTIELSPDGRVDLDRSKLPFLVEDYDLATTVRDIPPLLDAKTAKRFAARVLIRDCVNAQLRRGAYAGIDVKDGAPVNLIPRDLLGAMYVMFAQEIVGKSPPAAQCKACRAYFIPTDGRQIYCNDKCKFKGYRARKKQAGEQNDNH